jgi:hypothetical protein
MIIKAKYIAAIVLVILFTSGLIYEITDRTNSFYFILSGISLGSFLGVGFYCLLAHYGYRLVSKFFKD